MCFLHIFDSCYHVNILNFVISLFNIVRSLPAAAEALRLILKSSPSSVFLFPQKNVIFLELTLIVVINFSLSGNFAFMLVG